MGASGLVDMDWPEIPWGLGLGQRSAAEQRGPSAAAGPAPTRTLSGACAVTRLTLEPPGRRARDRLAASGS